MQAAVCGVRRHFTSFSVGGPRKVEADPFIVCCVIHNLAINSPSLFLTGQDWLEERFDALVGVCQRRGLALRDGQQDGRHRGPQRRAVPSGRQQRLLHVGHVGEGGTRVYYVLLAPGQRELSSSLDLPWQQIIQHQKYLIETYCRGICQQLAKRKCL